ncbi:MAG: VWA domain-containing protein [Archangium sp.]|nr:VWA domain-containing protein [Archangium sp.]
MNQLIPHLKTRVLLGTALILSVAAVLSMVTRPSLKSRAVPTALSTSTGVRIEAKASHPVIAPSGTEFFVEYAVTLQEGVVPESSRVSIAVVLDRSGSMNGTKLDDARRAVHRLVDMMKDGDELALITFGSEVTAGARVTLSDDSRRVLHAEIDTIVASGGTNISAGLQAGQRALESATAARRLILISDGQPTEGITEQYSLAAVVGTIHQARTTVTALGVGSDYDGNLLAMLSERGGGMVGHLQDVALLEEVLAKELTAARQAVARNVELRLDTHGANPAEAPGRTFFWEDLRPVLHLADLRANVPTRVLVRYRSAAERDAAIADVDAELRWTTLVGEVRTTRVPLQLVVVDDVEGVERMRDEPVFARGVSALGASRMLAAADAYQKGDDGRGSSLLDEARGLFGMSADALAGQGEVENVRNRMRKAGASERKSLNYGLEKKTLQNFGRENEGY